MIKVLYAEDEVFLGRIVKETLETKGFEIIMEADGGKVVQSFKATNPDICVLDIMMPNKNGYEVAQEIRQLNATVPIIFLTAKTQTNDVVKGFKTGGNDYLRKPFSMEELIVRIENLLKLNNANSANNTSEILVIGNFNFYNNKQVLTINSVERKLSFREAELLKFLYYNKNTIVDRREVLKHIWGNDSLFNSRNLDVYITKLRGYLKEDGNLEILTIKGIGYRFVVEA